MIREEVVSATNSQFKELIEGDSFRKIIRNETRDAIRAEIYIENYKQFEEIILNA